jgi:hypothetical protein
MTIVDAAMILGFFILLTVFESEYLTFMSRIFWIVSLGPEQNFKIYI